MKMENFEKSFKKCKLYDGTENLEATNNTPTTTPTSSHDTMVHEEIKVETLTTNMNVSDK